MARMPTPNTAIADSYALAHLSDPHLTSLSGLRARALRGKQLLGYLSWRHKRQWIHRPEVLEALQADLAEAAPDHIAVTGDFVHVGGPGELEQARAWLDRLGTPEQVSIVPGNHDAYTPASGIRWRALWQPFMRGDDGRDGFPYLRRRGPFSLIGASSAVPTPVFFASGRLGAAQRDELARLLRAEADRTRVLLIHHPPIAGVVSRRKALTDDDALRRLLEQYGAELVLYGHSHRAERRSLALKNGSEALLLSAPSASSAATDEASRAGYTIIRARREHGRLRLGIERRAYDARRQRFADVPAACEDAGRARGVKMRAASD